MKLNTNYVEGQCLCLHPKRHCDFNHGCNYGCGCPQYDFNFQPFPSNNCGNPFPNNGCGCFPPPCTQPCQPCNCGFINFQIPCSLLYLYAGYMIGNFCDRK